MGLIPKNAYPGQVDITDPAYPHGKARNVAIPGDGGGTPLEKAWINDVWGFFQAILHRANVSPSGQPDKIGASQYLDAIVGFVNALKSQNNAWTGYNRFSAGHIANSWGVSGEVLYAEPETGVPTPKQRVTIHPMNGAAYVRPGREDSAKVWMAGSGVTLWATGIGDTPPSFRHDIVLPRGATLQAWRILCFAKYNTSSGVGSLQKSTAAWSPPGPPVPETIGSAQVTVTGNAWEVIGDSGLSETIAAGSTYSLFLLLNTAAVENEVQFRAVELTWLDPGPSNVSS